ncbi:amidase family protein [Peristeroidobacter soli]|uniref:amidase family protein n=1 Tax=Peristeroidobacter soli TaxID=2497877 RepID=UPI00130073FC|nr:amidase family protein [Peristeroidobacter soli]
MTIREVSLSDALALGKLDAHDQARLVRAGELPVEALTEAAILRIDALDPTVRALSHYDPALARAEARALRESGGTMRGVPWLPKDSLDYPGMPTTSCSRSRTRKAIQHGYPYVQRMQQAGLVALGKSSMPEFGLLASTEPLAGPTTRNPWSLEHSPGGSSGGAVAAIAAGLVPLAHGSDGGGSIRLPSSCCGVVGLKPGRDSTVRVRARHLVEDLLVADSLHSRSVRDVAWGFAAAHYDSKRSVVTGPSSRRLRIAVIEHGLRGNVPHADVARAIASTADLCASLGHKVERTSWPIDGHAFLDSFENIWSHLAADCVDATRALLGGGRLEDAIEPWTIGLGKRAEGLPTTALERAYQQIARLPIQLNEFFSRFDVVLSPVTNAPPPLLGTYGPAVPMEQLMSTMFDWIAYTPLQNMAGTPAISLPLFQSSEGLPIGSMFAADRAQEDVLLTLAFELEAALPWAQRWPRHSVATFNS